ncbi:RsmE family RNA methyltransferase [Spiroplasma tabanidicola]|uniref:Ribosomal RNA small subunit methyltransferase E n=1 Tax=Spiroplasma tabanidicola TaxID=324079 RepID=A0A6I6CID9_9MOLU|nr:RsmE family RNA methyltransferase [Spiroplasma tabanidicola]QGS51833.1 16S rRNA (uracil1498-N3)-methyltransferase [Spiroplasma tabanidicola]
MFSFFVEKKSNNNFVIEDKDFHHIVNVVKLKIGEEIFCINNQIKYLCEIKEIQKDYLIATIKKEVLLDQNNVQVNLIVGIIREQKWDYVLQKATELGVTNIIPVQFKRNVVLIDDKKVETKIKRWQEICISAAKQSKRTTVPNVQSVIKDINDLKNIKADLNLIAYEDNKINSLKNYLQNNFNTINIVVGPEGGFEKKEVDFFIQNGYSEVSLGSNILRTETACLYLLSAIFYETN